MFTGEEAGDLITYADGGLLAAGVVEFLPDVPFVMRAAAVVHTRSHAVVEEEFVAELIRPSHLPVTTQQGIMTAALTSSWQMPQASSWGSFRSVLAAAAARSAPSSSLSSSQPVFSTLALL